LTLHRSTTQDRGVRPCRILPLLIAALSLGLAARAADAPVPSITVEGNQRAELRHEVDSFVNHALTHPHWTDALLRWDHPLCPLVAGLPREAGEFILRRVSTIAVAVHAPIGKQDCKPNLFIIVAARPDALLKLWWNRNPRLFDIGYGIQPVKRFIETPRPVRVWRNDYEVDADMGTMFTELLAQSAGNSMGAIEYPAQTRPALGSRLTRTVVRNIGSAIVVVDSAQVQNVGIGQLADYVTLVGLAEINVEAETGSAPTLLTLFRAPPEQRPAQMTPWDRALLRGLYSTRQKDTTQMSELETYALNDLLAHPAPP
jgi:hypothetical protein